VPTIREIVNNERTAKTLNGINKAIVNRVIPEHEVLKLDVATTTGRPSVPVRHPYLGPHSWIRCMPEIGTKCMVEMANTPRRHVVLGYISQRFGEVVYKATKDDNIIVRQLRPGEIEVMSSGKATTAWLSDGSVKTLGGVLEHDLDMDKLEIRQRTPTYRRELHLHELPNIRHEERFGVVKRPDTNKPFTREKYVMDGDKFLLEYGRWLYSQEDKLLVVTHEGNIYDENGKVLKDGRTGKPLRCIKQIGDSTGAYRLETFVDEELNVTIRNTHTRDRDTLVDMGDKHKLKIRIKDITLNAKKKGNLIFGNSLTIKTPSTHIKSNTIKLGNTATESAVLGNTLQSMLDTMLISLSATFNVLAAEPALSSATKQTIAGSVATLQSISALTNRILSNSVMVQ